MNQPVRVRLFISGLELVRGGSSSGFVKVSLGYAHSPEIEDGNYGAGEAMCVPDRVGGQTWD